MNNQNHNSKCLAYLLRHSDLPDRNAWVRVGVVLNEMSITLPMLQGIVAEDTKGRFEFSEDESSVRALYGHSIDVDLGLEPTTPPMILYHGTAEKYLENIMKDGLNPRKRNYVHLSETIDMAIQVGARHGKPIVLSIDTEAMISAGYKFYKAQNGVWLTNAIDKKYIMIKNKGMTTVKYWGEDLSFNENPISSEVLAKLIEMVHAARERAINASLDVENNLTSATALLLIEKMYNATKYDTSDIPNPDTPLNVTLNIFNHVYKLRLAAKYEEHFRKVAKEYNTAAKRIEDTYNLSQERTEQLAILMVAMQYYKTHENNE